MRHLDLFSGIGGFALAAQTVWGDDYENIGFCDNNEFCQQVLRKNFGSEVTIYDDIKEVTKERIIADTQGTRQLRPQQLQNSHKGQRGEGANDVIEKNKGSGLATDPQGKQDRRLQQSEPQRHARTTDERFTPDPDCRGLERAKTQRRNSEYAVGENIVTPDPDRSRHVHGQSGKQPADGHIEAQREPGTGIDTSGLCDLLTGGFPCQPFSQAGQRRGQEDDRYLWPEMLRVIRAVQPTWIIAENVRGLLTLDNGLVFEQVCSDLEAIEYEVQPLIIPAVAKGAPHRRDRVWFIANRQSGRSPKPGEARRGRKRFEDRDSPPPNPSTNLWGTSGDDRPGTPNGCDYDWSNPWPEVAAELCRVDDGVSSRLVRLPIGIKGGFKTVPGGEPGEALISHAKWRQEALKAYGNAIVPQVAIEIMKAIKECRSQNIL